MPVKKIESYTQLSQMITKQFRRGMTTNAFLSKDEWEAEIARGTLGYDASDNYLLVYRMRDTHNIMNFWLNGIFSDAVPEIPADTVLEIARRERDTALADVTQVWIRAGFALLFTRQRMACADTDGADDEHVRLAEPDEYKAVQAMLCGNFSPLTGCLPTEEVLRDDISSGGVLVYVSDSTVLGLLHFTADQKRTELRHLCVSETVRGQGIGDKLVKAYKSRTPDRTRHVWVRADYAPAVKIYENNGFARDGMTSSVLVKK